MINKEFLLQEVIDDLISTEKSLLSPLMKLNYFGRLTKNNALIDFTTKEMNGYSSTDKNIPRYRKTVGRLMVNLQHGYGNQETKEIPVNMLEEPFGEALKYMNIWDGISTIERMRDDTISGNGKGSEFYHPLPIQMLPAIQPVVDKLFISSSRLTPTKAKMIGNANVFIEIPNSIRTKLLDFAMKIADEFGYNIEIESFNKEKINNQTINNIMSTTINTSGDGNIINTGNENTVNAEITINKGDLQKLTSELQKQGIDEGDIKEIVEIVQSEQPTEDNNLGNKANNWILNVIGKSLKNIGKIASSVSANLLATMIKQYYGVG